VTTPDTQATQVDDRDHLRRRLQWLYEHDRIERMDRDVLLRVIERAEAAERELEVMRPVAKSASDADWYFTQHGKDRLTDADYAVLWRLRDDLEGLRYWAENDAAYDAIRTAPDEGGQADGEEGS
jgi:hypothetical protein